MAAAQAAGGANALFPVIKELRFRDQVQVTVAAHREAAQVFRREGVGYQEVKPPAGSDQELNDVAYAFLEQVTPGILLLGTSWGPSLDKALLRSAQARRIPSLAVLDMWSYYRERFTDPISGHLCLPTKIAVMDQLAFDQAVQAGLPRRSLIITGQPYLHEVATRLRKPEFCQQAESLRRAWLGGDRQQEDMCVVLFASEAFAEDFGPHTPYYRGYTEVDALEGLAETVQRIEDGTDHRVMIVIKLHPEQTTGSLRMGPRATQRSIHVVTEQPAWPCILAADVIVGMTSMFLIEAALAGKPVISFQPGVREKDFIGTQIGLIPTVSSAQELVTILKSAWTENPIAYNQDVQDKASSLAQGGAARRVANAVLDLVHAKADVVKGTAS